LIWRSLEHRAASLELGPLGLIVAAGSLVYLVVLFSGARRGEA
jgi:hypothetical protein